MDSTVLYCTVLYCTVLCCTVLYCTVLCCAVNHTCFCRQISSFTLFYSFPSHLKYFYSFLWSSHYFNWYHNLRHHVTIPHTTLLSCTVLFILPFFAVILCLPYFTLPSAPIPLLPDLNWRLHILHHLAAILSLHFIHPASLPSLPLLYYCLIAPSSPSHHPVV